MASPTPTDVGFAEFVSTLLAETLDAVSASLAEQEERRASMLLAIDLDLDSFAAEYVLAEELELLERTLFGDEGLKVGAKVPSADELSALGVTLVAKDSARRRLTASGVAVLRQAMSRQIASQRQTAWRALGEQGMPRLVVDHGRVLAKLTFQVLQDEGPAPKSKSKSKDPRGKFRPMRLAKRSSFPGSSATKRGVAAAIPAAIKDLRLGVRPASPGEPESGETRTDVYGEVEIGFRTVF